MLSRLDYCNSLYYGSSVNLINSLQTVMNAAARVVSGRRRYSHISDYMRDNLHWLPVAQRVQFKIATLIYSARLGNSPSYIKDYVRPSTRGERIGLRSTGNEMLLLNVPRYETKFAERAFAVSGPTVKEERKKERIILFINHIYSHSFNTNIR